MGGRPSLDHRPPGGLGEGLTAIELLIGAAVIVIVAAVSMPFLTSALEGYRLRAAAWQVAGDLRLARQKAVSTQVRHRLCFTNCTDPVPNPGYLVQREKGAIGSGMWEVDSSVDFSKEFVGSNLTISSNANVTFDPKGTAGPGTITLTNPSGTYRVVTAQTGRVQVCKGSC